ncbi:MAG: glucosyltransferase domain-containing protein, partial [Lachnospiraceae bacterium]|nr:glucosyltransferase domain-containing protein [Lachnospiraceae bacterium]
MEKAQKYTIKKWIELSLQLLRKPVYWGSLLITLLCAYGFFITHYAVGIDDTAMSRYFIEGLAPAQGRWVIFLVNKIIPLIYFTPFLTDFLGVLFLAVFAVLFCGLWQMLSEGRMRSWMLAIVACLIVSSPITSEVFVYYLHNGVSIGYVLTLMAVFLLFRTREQGLFTKEVVKDLFFAAGLLTIALGLYESFEVAFGILAAGVLLLELWYHPGELSGRQFWAYFVRLVLIMGAAVLLRVLIVNGIIGIWGFEKGQTRSLYLGWIFNSGAGATIRSYLQYIVLLFGLNGIFYV